MYRRISFWILTAHLAASPTLLAEKRVVAVSPGETDSVSLEVRCPTFSWAGVPAATGYELVVFEYSSDPVAAQSTPIVSKRLPGGAHTWTPGRKHCLRADSTYAWTIRAITEEGFAAWSAERLFRTEGGLEGTGVSQALEIVRSYLDQGGSLDELALASPISSGSSADPVDLGHIAARAQAVSDVAPKAGETDESDRSVEPAAGLAAPFAELGMSVELGHSPTFTGSAMRGVWEFGETARGYLGATVGALGGLDFDGLPEASGIERNEIGVLGISIGSASDNFGVVGITSGPSPGAGGRFFNADSSGTVSNEVRLGTLERSLEAHGPTLLDGPVDVRDTLQWDCPSTMYRVGTWCIDQLRRPQATLSSAINTCHDEGKILCPLHALVICDSRNTGKGDSSGSCGAITDEVSFQLRTSSIEYESGPSAFDRHIEYISGNQMSLGSTNDAVEFFCCKPVSP